MLDNAYDDAQCAVKFCMFLRDDGYFCRVNYLNTSQVLNN